MRHIMPLAWLLAVAVIGPANAQFTGKFELGPPGCEEKGLCTLTYDLRYADPNGVVWLAAAKDKTDGASIPAWAQPFVGKPFDTSYLKAAVIHDHYCDRHVRPWRQTHRVFYDGLVELGVSGIKAKLMYFGVYLGGPKWVELIPGKKCGQNCIFKFDPKISLQGGASAPGEAATTIMARPADYASQGFAVQMQETEKLLNEHGDKIDLQFLEARARQIRPDDFYYKHGDSVELGAGLFQ